MAGTTGNQYYRPGELRFDEVEWDHAKAETNVEKHDVAFIDAAKVFLDIDRIEQISPDGRSPELRWKTVGYSGDLLIAVIFTIRGENLRIITARRASRRERREYGSGAPL